MASMDLEAVARTLVRPGKGVLAADESHPTLAERFAALAIENTEENRRLYRQLLFTTPRLGDFISGVILFDGTIRKKAWLPSANDVAWDGARGPWSSPGVCGRTPESRPEMS
jgi:fructose-bisphosphate aldolase class 1